MFVPVVLALAVCTTTSGQGLALFHEAITTRSARVLIEKLSPQDALSVDPQKICAESSEAQGYWLDALVLLGMDDALHAYAQCTDGIDADLLAAMTLPLTVAKRARIAQSQVNLEHPDGYTMLALMALEADGSAESLVLCDSLTSKFGSRCHTDALTGNRIFDTPEEATANDPYLKLFKARFITKSRDGVRHLYELDPFKRPFDDTCLPIAVLKLESGRWSLERVECDTTSDIASPSPAAQAFETKPIHRHATHLEHVHNNARVEGHLHGVSV